MLEGVVPPAITLGSGPPVVLLHAFPVDGRMWLPFAERIARAHEVIVPDLRGFGKAVDQLEESAEILVEQMADDVARLIEERRLGRVVLGGSSRGGYVALAFARKFPQMLRGLLLVGTRATSAEQKERENYLEMADRAGREGNRFVPDLMRGRLLSEETIRTRSSIVNLVDEIILSQSADAIAAAARGMILRHDARPFLRDIAVPTLAIAGEHDAALGTTREIADGIDGARFVPIADAGHLCVLEQPETAAAPVLDFLAAV